MLEVIGVLQAHDGLLSGDLFESYLRAQAGLGLAFSLTHLSSTDKPCGTCKITISNRGEFRISIDIEQSESDTILMMDQVLIHIYMYTMVCL